MFLFVRFLGYTGLPVAFADWVAGLDMPPLLIIVCILLSYAVLGMFEETFSRIRNVDLSDTDLPPFLARAVLWITLESSKLRKVTAHMRQWWRSAWMRLPPTPLLPLPPAIAPA